MKRVRFSEKQILTILKRAAAASSVRDVCREHNITLETLHRWRKTYGGAEVREEQGSRMTRTERTREATLVNELGLQLVDYSPGDLDQLELPENLRDAIDTCHRMKMRARSRQKRLVCQILRGEDHEEIRAKVEQLERRHQKGG